MDCIAEGGKQDYSLNIIPHISGDNDLLVCLSDLHYGAEYASAFGSYNPKLARQRLGQYLEPHPRNPADAPKRKLLCVSAGRP